MLGKKKWGRLCAISVSKCQHKMHVPSSEKSWLPLLKEVVPEETKPKQTWPEHLKHT